MPIAGNQLQQEIYFLKKVSRKKYGEEILQKKKLSELITVMLVASFSIPGGW